MLDRIKVAVKKAVKVMLLMASWICVPVMVVLIASTRDFKFYEGHLYEMNYWWQVLVLTLAITCIICRVLKKNPYLNMTSVIAAVISMTLFVGVVLAESRWGIMKILDSIAGGVGKGSILFWIFPLIVAATGYIYVRIGRFVASDRA